MNFIESEDKSVKIGIKVFQKKIVIEFFSGETFPIKKLKSIIVEQIPKTKKIKANK